MAHPPPPLTVGKVVKTKHPDGKTKHHSISDQIHIYQADNKRKLIYLQKIKLQNGSEQLRLGYYIIGKKRAMRGRWVWGQYATFLPAHDFKRIIRIAKNKGWLK
jgi:hypothetical protein